MYGDPPELSSQLRRINCIAPIVTGAITHPIDEVTALVHCLKNRLQDLKITPLTIGANQISLPQLALIQNGPYSTGMVINVNPITNIFAVTYSLGRLPYLMLPIAAGMNFSSFCSEP